MRYSLLDHLACPTCHEDLVCVTHTEAPAVMPPGLFPDGARVSPGPGIGPLPARHRETPLAPLLASLAAAPAAPERGREVDLVTGLLVCGACGRWYPIDGGIPELLPDHLRDATRERALFDAALAGAPPELRTALAAFTPSGDATSDPGPITSARRSASRARSTIPSSSVRATAPPSTPGTRTSRSISSRSSVRSHPCSTWRAGRPSSTAACGYAWSTEWLFRSGFDVVGVDICRTYLEIGVTRIGSFRPHLVVGDVENLPLASAHAHAILAYESFHHIPDRRRAMASYDRVMRDGGTVILAEPGGAHEDAKVSVDAMEKYGILESGMELDDVAGYAEADVVRTARAVVPAARRSG